MLKKLAASLAVTMAVALPMALPGCTMPFQGGSEEVRSGTTVGSGQAPGGSQWPTMGWSTSDKRASASTPPGASPYPSEMTPRYDDYNPFDGGALEARWKYGEKYPDHDPANPIQKAQMGVNISGRESVEGLYNPNTLDQRLHGAGLLNGLTQNTFSPAGGDHNVTLDPAGKTMFYSTTRMSKNPKLAMQDVDSKAWTLLTDGTMADMMPAVSPNGRWLAWCSNRYGNWSLLLRPLDAPASSSPEQMTRTTDDDIHPSWSPDSQFLAFSRFNSMDGQWQIWILDAKKRTFTAITEGLFPSFSPRYDQKTPDGRTIYTIAYQRHRQRDVPWFSIWTIDIALQPNGRIEALGSPKEIISSNEWAAITPAWNPDGTYLAFASVRKSPLSEMQARIYRADDIWAVKLDGTDLTQITDHPAPDWYPCWAREPGNPVGRIFFTSSRKGNPTIWSVRPLLPGLLHELQGMAEREAAREEPARY